MQIIVVSDNHRDYELIEKLSQMYNKADLFLHAGDSCLREEEIYPFITVKGNQDYYITKVYRIIEANGINIFLFHGHTSRLDPIVLSAIARNNNCQIIIHGHTHKPYYQVVEGIHILCPGSLAYPRSSRGKTYAIIDIDNQKNINVRINDI